MTVAEVRIARVELTQNARKAWRDLHDEHPAIYPVLLWLSRGLDEFEVYSLRHSAGLFALEGQANAILITDTTLEAVEQNLAGYNAQIAAAAEHASKLRDAAYAEDQRLIALEQKINAALGNPNN